MVTHRKGYEVHTAVEVPGTNGTWGACATLPDVLGEDRIRSCEDLSRVLESQGGMVSRLLRGLVALSGFRLLARETRTRSLVGYVEWVQHDCGLWVQCDEEPWSICDYGQHYPERPATPFLALVA